jgi:hypothetical protein
MFIKRKSFSEKPSGKVKLALLYIWESQRVVLLPDNDKQDDHLECERTCTRQLQIFLPELDNLWA